MTTPEELEIQLARSQGQEVVLRWMRGHVRDYQESPESAAKIGDWLKANNRGLSHDNLELAFQTLTAQGVKFTNAPAEPTLDEVAPIPKWWPKLETMSDFAKLNPATQRKLVDGGGKEIFEKRLAAVQRGVKSAGATAAVATAPAMSNDDLPPVPEKMAHIKTIKDVNRVHPTTYTEWYCRDKDKELFKTRVAEILRRGV